MRTIRIGSKGDTVAKWQTFLKGSGYPLLLVDGVFGGDTHRATQGMQRQLKISADGIVGPLTWQAAGFEDSLEPPERGQAHFWPRHTTHDMTLFYGNPGEHLTSLIPPYQLYYFGSPISRFAIHRKCHDSALRVLERTLAFYGRDKIKELGLDRYAGCFNNRAIRGGTRLSTHAWGAAIDWDSERNQLTWGRDRAEFAKPIYDPWWAFWEDEGWVSLGRAANRDFMHTQAARL